MRKVTILLSLIILLTTACAGNLSSTGYKTEHRYKIEDVVSYGNTRPRLAAIVKIKKSYKIINIDNIEIDVPYEDLTSSYLYTNKAIEPDVPYKAIYIHKD